MKIKLNILKNNIKSSLILLSARASTRHLYNFYNKYRMVCPYTLSLDHKVCRILIITVFDLISMLVL